MSRFNKTEAAPKHTKQKSKKKGAAADANKSSADDTAGETNEDGNDLANTNEEEVPNGG